MIESLPVKLLISLLLGAAIGLERESSSPSGHAVSGGGVRTFALVALTGSFAGLFYVTDLPIVFALVTAAFIVLLAIYYIMASSVTKDFGLTTEISFILTYLVGVSIAVDALPLQLSVAVAVVLMLVLALKDRSRELLSEVTRHEIEAFIGYAIIALVILPFLPNTGYTLSDIPFLRSMLEGFGADVSKFTGVELLNPRRLWFIVVLVTGIDVLGYVLSKFIGAKKGFAFTSFIGGFISSTSTTQSLAQRSKKAKFSDYLVGAAVLANLASFFQIFLLVGPLNGRWLVSIVPTLLIMIVSSGFLAFYFLRRKAQGETEEGVEGSKKIFSLIPALKFAVLIILVRIVTNVCLVLFGQSGFLVSSIIASFVGIDAILVNLATMAGSTVTFQFSLLTLLIVNATNLLSKTLYSFLQGNRKFALKFMVSALVIIAASFAGLLFL